MIHTPYRLSSVIKTAFLLFASVFIISSTPVGAQDSSAITQPPGAKPYIPKPIPSITFYDEKGVPITLDAFKGKVILLNFWATWCGPCVAEMPAMDVLQAELEPFDFVVIPISQNVNGINDVKAFYRTNKLKNLPIYMDRNAAAFNTLDLRGLPATLLIDRDGYEAVRISGYVDWFADTARVVLTDLIQRSEAQ